MLKCICYCHSPKGQDHRQVTEPCPCAWLELLLQDWFVLLEVSSWWKSGFNPVFLGLMHAHSPCPQIRMLQKGDPINVGFSSLQSSEINWLVLLICWICGILLWQQTEAVCTVQRAEQDAELTPCPCCGGLWVSLFVFSFPSGPVQVKPQPAKPAFHIRALAWIPTDLLPI